MTPNYDSECENEIQAQLSNSHELVFVYIVFLDKKKSQMQGLKH
jgi:hypothetical protein